MTPQIEEFALDGERAPQPRDPSGRDAREWRRSPWPWVAAAVALVIAGAVVSPRGERPEPGPPPVAWRFEPQMGRAPQVWALRDLAVITEIDGVTALDTTGNPVWTVPLDDPAYTVADEELTCVYGEGAEAAIATITAAGELAADHSFPGADIAHAIDGDVIVAGSDTRDAGPWLGRTRGAEEPDWVWRVDSRYPGEVVERWQEMTLSQGIATVRSRLDAERFPGALAADTSTGAERAAVQLIPGGLSVSGGASNGGNIHTVLPLLGLDPTIDGHPDAIVTSDGVFTEVGGEPLLDLAGLPLGAAGDDVIAVVVDPDRWRQEQWAMRVERIDVPTGAARWSLPRSMITSCPCAMSESSLIVANVSLDPDTQGFDSHIEPYTLLGIDLDSGQHRWTLPITAFPDGLAVGNHQAYVLSEGALTAYSDR